MKFEYYAAVPMRLAATVALVLFAMCTFLLGIKGHSYKLFEGNFTYTMDAILENEIGATTLLECARRCSFYDVCSAIEYDVTTTSCVILKTATSVTTRADNMQYMRAPCSIDWTVFMASCYWVSPVEYYKESCEYLCTGVGGYHTAVTSSREGDFIAWFCGINDKSIWIGGIKESAYGKRVIWDNGETSEYHNWNPGQPNHSEGNDWCIWTNQHHGDWYDQPCYSNFFCLCEK